MKLFQRLLVAPAALGLMAPIAVNAAELNLTGVSDYTETSQEVQNFSDVYPTDWAFQALTNLAKDHGCNVSIPTETISRYEAAALLNKCLKAIATELNTEERRLIDEFAPELAVIKGRVDGIGSGIGEFQAGQFSSTTTMSGSAVLNFGSVTDGGTDDTQDSTYLNYAYALDLNTSLNGDDLLYAGIEAGNYQGPFTNMDAATEASNGQALTVTSLFYSFPFGDNVEITVGPLVDVDDVIASTGSIYDDSFRWGALPFSTGGNTNEETGTGLAFSYANDEGFVASASRISINGSTSSKGLLSQKGIDVTVLSAGYDAGGFGAGVVTSSNDGDGASNLNGYDTVGGGLFWRPDSIDATFSVAFDYKDPESGDDQSNIFVGINYETGPGVLGLAYTATDVNNRDEDDEIGYEVVYSYPVNDNVTVVPGIFYDEETTSGYQDDTGVFVETTFSF